jgi:hypothetical protein
MLIASTLSDSGSGVQVANHLSYMDIIMCAAVFGPYSAVARHDLMCVHTPPHALFLLSCPVRLVRVS